MDAKQPQSVGNFRMISVEEVRNIPWSIRFQLYKVFFTDKRTKFLMVQMKYGITVYIQLTNGNNRQTCHVFPEKFPSLTHNRWYLQ